MRVHPKEWPELRLTCWGKQNPNIKGCMPVVLFADGIPLLTLSFLLAVLVPEYVSNGLFLIYFRFFLFLKSGE